MASPNPIPRKYMNYLESVQDDLQRMAQKAKRALTDLRFDPIGRTASVHLLLEIEATAYRLALELSDIRIADDCDGCPAAPPTTIAQSYLLVMADELERQAVLARHQAQSQGTLFEEVEEVLRRKKTL
ncbi:MAG: hypothetical protein KAZ26_21425 [Caldilineaceae bacterium]|nr:hypothetical protein [Caldilineaceae bacterium]MBP8125222.1 hypothetical protein [Caldilineaceae bacterium]